MRRHDPLPPQVSLAPAATWHRTLALTAYTALCLIYVTWGRTDDLADLGGDSTVYMLMARYLSPFYPVSTVLAGAVGASAYPPLFPMLIGLCGGSMLAGHLIAIACLLAALSMLFLWLRNESLALPMGFWLTAIFALQGRGKMLLNTAGGDESL